MEAGFFNVIEVDIKISLNPYKGSGFLFAEWNLPVYFYVSLEYLSIN